MDIILWAFAINVIFVVYGYSFAFYTDLKSMGFKHALETCKQRNETVIFPSTAEEISELKFFMKSRGSHKAWILLTRTEFNIPRWEIRNSTGTDMELIPSSPTFGCGYVDRRERVVGYQQCSKDLDGFICQNQDSKCTYKKDKLYSRKHIPSKTCFIYSNKLTSWFGARTECSSIGAILAIPTVDTLKATEAVDPRLGGQYWIGLHRVAWTVSDSEPKNFLWNTGEPQEEKACVIFDREEGSWASANCNKSHHVICKSKPNGVTPDMRSTTHKPPSYIVKTSQSTSLKRIQSQIKPDEVKEACRTISCRWQRGDAAFAMLGFLIAMSVITLLVIVLFKIVKGRKKKDPSPSGTNSEGHSSQGHEPSITNVANNNDIQQSLSGTPSPSTSLLTKCDEEEQTTV